MTARITLAQLAQQLESEFVGNPNLEIHGVVHPAKVQSEHDMAMVMDKGIIPLLMQQPPQTALVPQGVDLPMIPNQIRVQRPKLALQKLLDIFERPVHIPRGIHPSSVIDPTARLGENVQIGPLCAIGPGAVIGDNTRLVSHVTIGANAQVDTDCLFYPGARIGDRVQVGKRVIVGYNTSIGSEGYSYVTPEPGSVDTAKASGRIQALNTEILKVNSIGTVILENDVEIGANTTIQRATLDETRIKRGSKIGDLNVVAHNVTIGENVMMIAQIAVGGSAVVGDRCVLAGQVGVKDHVKVAEDTIAMADSIIASDVKTPRQILVGFPAVPQKEYAYKEMQIKRIKGLSEQIKALTARLEALEKEVSQEGQLV